MKIKKFQKFNLDPDFKEFQKIASKIGLDTS